MFKWICKREDILKFNDIKIKPLLKFSFHRIFYHDFELLESELYNTYSKKDYEINIKLKHQEIIN